MACQSLFEVATGFLQPPFHHRRAIKETRVQSEIQNCFIQLLEAEFKCSAFGVVVDMKIEGSMISQVKLGS
ncbi:unnamed protein product [Rodentolepis nana]|uniref:Uncharacterized protein n=1 Tax=Rodentolepis nana TaxID=102285 RepID=A0A0R3TXY5_RODNA|nr:unnamed protein product [Rodentolepis nana]